jgi:hypothetical protein
MSEEAPAPAVSQRVLRDLRFTREQTAHISDVFCKIEAQLGALSDSLNVLQKQLANDAAGQRGAYAFIMATDLLHRIMAARIEAQRYQESLRPDAEAVH